MKRNIIFFIPVLLFASCSRMNIRKDTIPNRYNRVINGSNYTMTIDIYLSDIDNAYRTLILKRDGYKMYYYDASYSESGELYGTHEEIYVGYKDDKSIDYYRRGDNNPWEYKNGIDEGLFNAMFLNIVDESHYSHILFYSWLSDRYEEAVYSEGKYYYPNIKVTYGEAASMEFYDNEVTIDETTLKVKSYVSEDRHRLFMTTFHDIGKTIITIPNKSVPAKEPLLKVELDGNELYKSDDGITLQEYTAESIEEYLDKHNTQIGRNDIGQYAFCYSFDFDASSKNLDFKAEFAGKNAETLINIMRILLRVEDKETGKKQNIYFGADSVRMSEYGKDYRSPISNYEVTEAGTSKPLFSSDGNDGYCRSFQYDNSVASDLIDLYEMNNIRVTVVIYLEGYDENCSNTAPIEESLDKMYFSFISVDKRTYEWQ